MKILILFTFLFFAFSVSAQTGVVIANDANLRGTPTETGVIINSVEKDASLEIIKQKGAWFLVQTSQYVGWIHGNKIKIVNTKTETKAANFLGGYILISATKKDDDGLQYYYQPSSVKTDVLGFKKVWLRIVPFDIEKFIQKRKLPKNTAFFQQLFTAICSDDRYSMESGILYDANQNIITSKRPFSSAFYEPTIPKTVSAEIVEKLCK